MSEPTRIVQVGPAAAHVNAPPPPGFTMVQVAAMAVEIGSARHTHAAARRRVHAERLGGRVAKGANANGGGGAGQDKFAGGAASCGRSERLPVPRPAPAPRGTQGLLRTRRECP